MDGWCTRTLNASATGVYPQARTCTRSITLFFRYSSRPFSVLITASRSSTRIGRSCLANIEGACAAVTAFVCWHMQSVQCWIQFIGAQTSTYLWVTQHTCSKTMATSNRAVGETITFQTSSYWNIELNTTVTPHCLILPQPRVFLETLRALEPQGGCA